MNMSMKRFATAILILAAFCAVSGCKHQPSDKDAIRAGILQHLKAVGTLNISAMEMDIRNVSINGNQAHAEVEFRPKTGAAPGTGMQVAYNLEKHDGSWTVLKTQAAGGTMQHPDPNQNPHQNQAVHSGSLPNFNDVLKPTGASGQATTLPPGHPGVASQQLNAQSAGQDAATARKPR
jgi:hypothetical protein